MKPQKNIVYCAASHRKKMIFETKAKADNFILYNKDEIEEENGKAPVRSYYCLICGGYHVTSNPSKRAADRFDRMDEKLAEATDERIKTNYEIGPLLEAIEKKRVLVEVYGSHGDRLLGVGASPKTRNKERGLHPCRPRSRSNKQINSI